MKEVQAARASAADADPTDAARELSRQAKSLSTSTLTAGRDGGDNRFDVGHAGRPGAHRHRPGLPKGQAADRLAEIGRPTMKPLTGL